ncbi:YigZ family protein [Bernardetia sp. Wsw4-3y2]|uniref:YigZ family protein n=1 Tax=unclassified Bernardetia TaxID=2647129 RepID=UPI0030CE06EC
MDTFLTIKEPSEGEYKEKGSKFLAFAFQVRTEDEIKERLDELRKKYYDARHHCYAYQLGQNGELWRANDDGEPNHSAGTPILNQIKSFNITDVLVVVIRYFGGTKLGVSGLINAYKTSTQEALENAEIEEKIITKIISFSFDYLGMNDVMKLIKDYDLEIINQEFTNTCQMKLSVRLAIEEEVEAKLQDIKEVKMD